MSDADVSDAVQLELEKVLKRLKARRDALPDTAAEAFDYADFAITHVEERARRAAESAQRSRAGNPFYRGHRVLV